MLKSKKYMLVYIAIAVLVGFSFANDGNKNKNSNIFIVDSSVNRFNSIHIVADTLHYNAGTINTYIENLTITTKMKSLSNDSIIIRISMIPLRNRDNLKEELNHGWSSGWITIKKTDTINLKDFNPPKMKEAECFVGLYEDDNHDTEIFSFIKFNIYIK